MPGGADKFVDYEERTEYIRLVRNCRMAEGKAQVCKFPYPTVVSLWTGSLVGGVGRREVEKALGEREKGIKYRGRWKGELFP